MNTGEARPLPPSRLSNFSWPYRYALLGRQPVMRGISFESVSVRFASVAILAQMFVSGCVRSCPCRHHQICSKLETLKVHTHTDMPQADHEHALLSPVGKNVTQFTIVIRTGSTSRAPEIAAYMRCRHRSCDDAAGPNGSFDDTFSGANIFTQLA